MPLPQTLKLSIKSAMKPLGYLLMSLSAIAWLLVLIVPFLSFSMAQTAAIITALIISAEIMFYIAILLLGKPLWQKLKQLISKPISKHINTPK